MRVLIVEDEVRLAEALGQIMAEHRYLADLVYTGPDGLEYGLTNQYDVIVLDVMLPGMDGLAVAGDCGRPKCPPPSSCLPPGTRSRTKWRAWTMGPTTT